MFKAIFNFIVQFLFGKSDDDLRRKFTELEHLNKLGRENDFNRVQRDARKKHD